MTLIKGVKTYGNPTLLGELSNVIVGNYCSISDSAKFDCGCQHNKFITTFPLNQFFPELNNITSHPKTNGDIIIGNDVWIGENTMIMSGVKIGDGAIIGAGAIVRKDVEPYEIVKNQDVNRLRKEFRFNALAIKSLLEIKWWNWPEEKIIENGELLMSNDYYAFIDKHLYK